MAIKLIKNPDERNDPPKPLLEHLLALRDMLVFAAVSWAIGVIVVGLIVVTGFVWWLENGPEKKETEDEKQKRRTDK